MFSYPAEIPQTKKEGPKHPWARSIKNEHEHFYKLGHNSINNPKYPEQNNKNTKRKNLDKFIVIGNRITKEFIYCTRMVNGLYKYRKNRFDVPMIRGVTGVEWPTVLNDLKLKFGGETYCMQSQVAVILNDEYIGGKNELEKLIESTYKYYIRLDYYKEGINEFYNFLKNSGRSCAYMHISINGEHIGTFLFMLYVDIVPNTCENFLRLCKIKKGGYSGTPVHRIVKDGWIQCGGFGIKSIDMECENFIVPHDRRGVLCMANDGRHVDCSTQFFVLLQPAPWMAHKYVAFGQLIEGEDTLKKIESIPTWYESPKSDIKIFRSGILNMECQNIKVTTGTKDYITGHIEDLYALEEYLWETIIERVFLELEFKHVAALSARPESPETEVEETGSLRATKRFIKKKQDFEPQTDNTENKDFDVDEYDYEPEEPSYQHVSLTEPSVVMKEEKPYYLPLTDVPYPDEIESNYDLKKFLKGYYCLELDLEKKIKPIPEEPPQFPSELFDLDEEESVASEGSLASDDENEIKRYIKMNVDRVSFAGGIIKGIARGVGKFNLFDETRKSELISDDKLRRFRLASLDQRCREEKKVSISLPVEDKAVHTKIKRRQTGFVRAEDLEKIHIIHKPSFEESPDIDESSTAFSRKVRISPGATSSSTRQNRPRRPTAFVRSKATADDSDTEIRQSVLTRLYEEVTFSDEMPTGPTLKDYKPMSENPPKNLLLLTYSPDSRIKSDESSREKYIRRSLVKDKDLHDQVLNLQHGKRIAHKISSDYVKTIDQIEHRLENSLRSIEFAKTRPSLSVAEYQLKNMKYREELKNSIVEQDVEIETDVMGLPSNCDRKRRSIHGIRLPGDTPLYSMTSIHQKSL